MLLDTRIIRFDEPGAMQQASALLASGKLVAFPTETVYGLGANGLDAEAVRKIFLAKGRPNDNPLILHVASLDSALPLWKIDREQRERLESLASAFWPGPLSLVLPASEQVPLEVTAGLPTVAVRSPANPVAQALLAECEFPLAAPSANTSGRPSPTTAGHVLASLQGKIDAVIDGGQTRVGIESTVLDISTERPRLLRLGGVSQEAIEAVIGVVERGGEINTASSPGLRHKHYQPQGMALYLVDKVALAARWQEDVAVICMASTAVNLGERVAPLATMSEDSDAYAAMLYASFYRMEQSGANVLLIEKVPDLPDWEAIQDRLSRAAEA